MRPEVFYLAKILPVLLLGAVGCYTIGSMCARVLWIGRKRRATRLQQDCEALHRDMRAARRKRL